MLRNLTRASLPGLVALVLLMVGTIGGPTYAVAADKPSKAVNSRSEVDDVLTLLEKGMIDVELSAHGAYRLEARIWNLTKAPVDVRFPPGLVADAFGQNEVLAQIRGGNGSGGPGSSGGGSSAGSQGLALIESPAISVSGNDNVLLNVRTVCLNFGLPEPTPRSPLFLKRVHEYTTNAKVRALLPQLAKASVPANVAQYALWHYTNGLSWDQLARIPARTGQRMNPADFQLARRWAAGEVPSEDSSYAETKSAKNDRLADEPASARSAESYLLAVQINPDPRGGNGAGIARAVAHRLQADFPSLGVSHANLLPKDESSPTVVCWQVLVKAPAGRGPSLYKKPMMLTFVRSDWDPHKQHWKRDRPRVVKVVAEEAVSIADLAAAVNRQLMQEIASQAISSNYSAAKRELTLVNTLPVAVAVREIKSRRDAVKSAAFDDLIVPPNGKKTIAVGTKLVHEPGRTMQPVVAAISLEWTKS